MFANIKTISHMGRRGGKKKHISLAFRPIKLDSEIRAKSPYLRRSWLETITILFLQVGNQTRTTQARTKRINNNYGQFSDRESKNLFWFNQIIRGFLTLNCFTWRFIISKYFCITGKCETGSGSGDKLLYCMGKSTILFFVSSWKRHLQYQNVTDVRRFYVKSNYLFVYYACGNRKLKLGLDLQ